MEWFPLEEWATQPSAPPANPPSPPKHVPTKVWLDGVPVHKVVSAHNEEIVVVSGPKASNTQGAAGVVKVEAGEGWVTELTNAFAYWPSSAAVNEDFDEIRGRYHSQGWIFSDMFGSSHSDATIPSYFRVSRDKSKLADLFTKASKYSEFGTYSYPKYMEEFSHGHVEMPEHVEDKMAEVRLGAGYGLNIDPACSMSIRSFSFNYTDASHVDGKKIVVQ